MSPLKRLGLAALLLAAAGGTGAYIVVHRRAPITRAEQFIDQKRPAEAILVLRSIARDTPRDSRPYMLMATADAQLGDAAAAERDLKRARSLGADHQAVLLALGPAYLAQRKFRDIITEIPFTATDPATAARFGAFRSRALLGLDDVKGAELVLRDARTKAPDLPDIRLAASRIAAVQNDPARAEAELDAGLAADPRNVEMLLVKTQMRAAAGAVAEAATLADRAVDAAPALPAAHLARANQRVGEGDNTKAQDDVAAVLAIQPRNAQAIYLKAVLAVRNQRFVEAADLLQNLGAAAARFPRAPYFQALAALGRNLPSSATEYAARYAAQVPGDVDGIRLLARAQAASSRPDLAAKTLKDAIALGASDPQTLDQYALALAVTGDDEAATDVLHQALGKAPDSPAVLVDLATQQTRAGRAAQASASLENLDQVVPEQPPVLQALATAQIVAGDPDRAAATIDRLRARSGDTETTGILTGMLALARLDPDAAIAAFAKTLAAFPDSTVASLDLAKALAQAGRRDEARARLNAMLAKDRLNLSALETLVQIEIAGGRLGPAIRATEATLAAAPGQDGVRAMQADLMIRAGDAPGAVALLTQAHPDPHTQPGLLAALARAQEAARLAADAIASNRAILAAAPDTAAALNLARLLHARNDDAGAAATLDDAIARTPGNLVLLTRRVQFAAEIGGIDAGLQQADRLAQTPAQRPAAALLAGDLLMQANRPKDAIQRLTQLAQGNPTPTLLLRLAQAQVAAGDDQAASATLGLLPADDPDGALLLSNGDIRAQRWPDAIRHTEAALRARPNDPGLLNNLAWAYDVTGDNRARATAQRAFLLAPTPEASDTLGWILARAGDAKRAIALLRQSVDKRPDDPVIRYHLAVALEGSGDTTEAAQQLKRALALDATFDGHPAASALLARLEASR